MNKIIKEITNCMDCDHSHEEKVYTPDPFDHETGLYCSLCKEKDGPLSGHSTDDRLIAADDWDLRNSTEIPEWCPLLKNSKEVK